MNMAAGTVPYGHDGFMKRVEMIKQSLGTSEAAENVDYNYKTTFTVVDITASVDKAI